MLSWQVGFLLSAVVVSCLVTAILLVNIWNNRHAPGAIPFSVMMLLNTGWLLGSTIQWNSGTTETLFLFFRISFTFVPLVPLAFFLFALQFTQKNHATSPKTILFTGFFPVLTQIMVWTNQFHQLVWADFDLIKFGSLTAIRPSFNPWFWLHSAYSYILILISLALLINHLFQATSLSRRQTGLIIVSLLFPLTLNMAFLFNITPGFAFDLTPLTFALISPVVVFGIMRLHIFDLIPIQRGTLIDGISDGIIVIDQQNRVTDLNPAACQILDIESQKAIGMDITSIAPVLAPWMSYETIQTWQQPQIQIPVSGRMRHYNLRISSLKKRSGAVIGRMIILRNVTRLKESEMAERDARKIAEARSADLEVLNHLASTLNKASTLKEATSSGIPLLLTHTDADAVLLSLSRNLSPSLIAAVQVRSGPLDPSLFDHDTCSSCHSYEDLFRSDVGLLQKKTCQLMAGILPENPSGQHLCISLRIGERLLGSLHLAFSTSLENEIARENFYTTIAQQFSAAIERTCLFEDVQRMAVTDPLTGLFNRRHFDYLAERELRRAVRMQRPLGMIMMDLDHFKQVNDLYGHLAGDRILKEIAERCQAILREIDLLARFGGEEFIFLLPECTVERTFEVAERLRKRISDSPFITQKDLIWVTASLGISSLPLGKDLSLDELIHSADLSLYRAKSSGRNRVTA